MVKVSKSCSNFCLDFRSVGEVNGAPIGAAEDGCWAYVDEDHSVSWAEVVMDEPFDSKGALSLRSTAILIFRFAAAMGVSDVVEGRKEALGKALDFDVDKRQ